jgi:DNA replication protein DnaC
MSLPNQTCRSRLLDRLATLKAQTAQATVQRINRLTAARDARTREAGFTLDWRGPWVKSSPPELHTEWVKANPNPTWPKMDGVIRMAESLEEGRLSAMIGPRGTGKTQLAAWIMANRDGHGMYFRAADLMSTMKSWYSLPSDQCNHNNRLLATVPLLVIDEMQERVETEHEDKIITALIDKRYGNLLPTLLVANLTLEKFSQHVGPSIDNRIREGGMVLLCDWPSFRTPTKSLQHSQQGAKA